MTHAKFSKIFYLLLLSFISCAGNNRTGEGNPLTHRLNFWTLEQYLLAPESAHYVEKKKWIFVSNVNGSPVEKDGNGYISTFSEDGSLLQEKWAIGLNAPKGIRADDQYLWVADINKLLAFNLETGKCEQTYTVSGAKFLNDVAIASDGSVFVSDMFTSAIYVLKNKKVKIFDQGKHLENPNGLLVLGEELYVASWGLIDDYKTFETKVAGRLYSLNLKTKKQTYISAAALGNLDGLEVDKDGNFLVTDWPLGVLYRISKSGKSELLYANFQGAADIGIIPEKKMVLVPRMKENKLSAMLLPQ